MFPPLIILAILLFFPFPALSQPGYTPADVVTYTDSRGCWCIDLAWREVFIATNGGLWRFDRATGEPLDPWLNGIGYDTALPLTGASLVIWHKQTNTLWVAAVQGGQWKIYAGRLDLPRWSAIDWTHPKPLTSLGVTRDYVLLEDDTGGITAIDPYALTVVGSQEPPEDARWTGKRARQPHEFPPYQPIDRWLTFNSEDGSIQDWTLERFKPAYELLDEHEGRHYICYPGLGIAVAEERWRTLELYQPGPAGVRVKALTLDPDGNIWLGGDQEIRRGGFSRWDRSLNRWSRSERSLEFGIKSNLVWSVAVKDETVFFGNDLGVTYKRLNETSWNSLGSFDGLYDPGVRALEVVGDRIAAGGDRGLNLITTDPPAVWQGGYENLPRLHVADLASDGDTLWAAAVEGVYKILPDGSWLRLQGDDVIGDEPARSICLTDNFIWMGGLEGIRQFNRLTGERTAHPGAQFLDSGKPLALTANDSLLFVGTDRGLFRFNRLRGSWFSYGIREGLPHPRIDCLELEADTLWMGTPRGLVRFLWNNPQRDGGW